MINLTEKTRGVFLCTVRSNKNVGGNIYVLRFECPELALTTRPGQFINIKVSDGYIPLLRRPFSVYRVEQNEVEIIFNAIGTGTTVLSKKKAGDVIDVLGPLGVSFNIEGDYDHAILIAGGLGVAPLPILTDALKRQGRAILTFLGARSSDQLVTDHLTNVSVATEDGSRGFHGTVVDLFATRIRSNKLSKPKIFGCGPNAMLKNLASMVSSLGIPTEISVECAMACGFGICQGCPVERNQSWDAPGMTAPKYYLVCRDGPVFNANSIILQ